MEIVIDWKEIQSEDQFYDYFLPKVSAPSWHGRNLNALGDSIVTGDVNGIEPPYKIVIKNKECVSVNLQEFQDKVIAIFSEAIEDNREIELLEN